ncbi:DUF1259 domain-containing protein [Pseudohongiella sp. SYSU M77423]|uniref:DUF1259 domain-containing protein n=1 Tax=Pseudohongiella sp. SYSU M77423 TaxID=3042312 RepID=UPI00248128C8|nr:DUF1259 domain-containing protein [Pseudohongiella sp. SYSU M77423]MDH7945141.1 DUF1259 domain-containing protein [Pseudohongiella sp. SYSU M77423]
MKTQLLKAVSFTCAVLVAIPLTLVDAAEGLDSDAISRAAGTSATVQDDGVVRIAWSRDDVPVTVDGILLPTQAGLGSWAAFKELADGGVMLMGDTVVFEDEITPAMDAAIAHNLDITGLHNHFIFDRPAVYFMHIGGHGQDAEQLAVGVKAMWDAIKAVRQANPEPGNRFPGEVPEITGRYNVDAIETILESESALNGQVLRFTFGRTATMHGTEFGASMGLSTWAAFAGNADHAVVAGDFAMTTDEVQPVLRALREAGIHVVTLHNHMTGETPAYYFLHYWGNNSPEVLARGIRAALDTQD